MVLFGIGISILICGSLLVLLTGKKSKYVHLAGAVFSITGSGVMAAVSLFSLFIQPALNTLTLPWELPLGRLTFALNPLSSFFLLIISVISLAASIYAPAYLRHYEDDPARMKKHWFFYLILTASMMAVVTAQNAVLFLIAWEMMSLSSFFLVVFQSDKEKSRNAGWIYLVATHIGTALLLVMFAILARECGSYDFAAFRANSPNLTPELSGMLFIFAVIGFGTKAGFLPMHVWLPEAHPAAPSHISAVMSGVMIKTGIFGIITVLSFTGNTQEWWGWVLLIIGVVSGITGILMAVAQHDLKRLLAYSSVENIGIISMGIGIGIIGKAAGSVPLMLLGFTGGLLHVLNHAVFKSLLFMGAGSIQYAAHTLQLDKMGGLLKKMPFTGAAFLIGAAAIAGLPPLNGFIGEFLIYTGAFKHLLPLPLQNLLFSIVVIGGLSLIGGLAVFCFTKVFGVAFQGSPRSPEAADAKETSPLMIIPLIFLATVSIGIGIFPRETIGAMSGVIEQVTDSPIDTAVFQTLLAPLGWIQAVSLSFAGIVLLLLLVRWLLLRGRSKAKSGTWGCGYSGATPKMQYTSSSYSQPVLSSARAVLRTKSTPAIPDELFPARTGYETHTPDSFLEKLFQPAFLFVQNLLSRIKIIQHGNLHLYVLYILISLFVLLIIGLGL